MNGVLLVAVTAVAGGFGAVMRYLLETLLRQIRGPYPWALTLINVSGSYLMGFVVGWTTMGIESAEVVSILGVGFFGGYTTFSSASLETLQLLRAGSYGLALLQSAFVLVSATALAGVGLWCGSLLSA